MITISVKDDMMRVLKKLDALSRRQIPFIVARALTDTARDAKKDLVAIMPRVFDNPTPYTLNSIYVTSANKQTLEAVVGIKDQASKGTPAAKYLQPEITGGGRRIKRVERLLSGKGILPAGMAVVPVKDTALDSYGNVKRSEYGSIIRRLEKQSISKASGKRTRKTKNGTLFVPNSSSTLAPGVWQRNGVGIRPLLLFVQVPKYRARFDFAGTVSKTVRSTFQKRLDEAIAFALATSR